MKTRCVHKYHLDPHLMQAISGQMDDLRCKRLIYASMRTVNYLNLWLLLAPLYLLIIASGVLFMSFIESYFPRYIVWTLYFVIAVVCYPLVNLESRYRRKLQMEELGRRLITLGIRPNFCLICGYNLTGSTDHRCPECGCVLIDEE